MVKKIASKFIDYLTILVIIFLDWAALRDIIRGNQPNYYWEYGFLLLSLVLWIILLFRLIKRINFAMRKK